MVAELREGISAAASPLILSGSPPTYLRKPPGQNEPALPGPNHPNPSGEAVGVPIRRYALTASPPPASRSSVAGSVGGSRVAPELPFVLGVGLGKVSRRTVRCRSAHPAPGVPPLALSVIPIQ